MSIAYWCVLAAGMLPYFTIGVAKALGPYDNRDPRAGTYDGLARRAHGAHLNGFEVFSFFAAAILVASHADARTSVPLLDALAGLWIALRLAYTAAYFADRASARSLIWIAGLVVTVFIFTMPAWHG